MASRVNYFRVADLLGANHAPLDIYRLPHSAMTFRLWSQYREYDLMRQLNAAQFVAYSSMMGNSFIDLKRVAKMVSDLYSRLYSCIPYIKSSLHGQQIDAERENFIKQYAKLKKEIDEQAKIDNEINNE